MDATSMRRRAGPLEYARKIDWNAVFTWALGFGLVVYLGLKGGGYDPLVHDQVGIAVWWVLLATVLVGALPRRRPGPLGWAALGLLAAFVAWTALSLSWTESVERTWADLARVAGYLGVFALALFARDRRSARPAAAAARAATERESTNWRTWLVLSRIEAERGRRAPRGRRRSAPRRRGRSSALGFEVSTQPRHSLLWRREDFALYLGATETRRRRRWRRQCVVARSVLSWLRRVSHGSKQTTTQ